MIWLTRKCLKCGGNLYVDEDKFGKYTDCLQCGCIEDYKGGEVKKKDAELQKV
jgi:hypothetical protein